MFYSRTPSVPPAVLFTVSGAVLRMMTILTMLSTTTTMMIMMTLTMTTTI